MMSGKKKKLSDLTEEELKEMVKDILEKPIELTKEQIDEEIRFNRMLNNGHYHWWPPVIGYSQVI